MSLLRPIHPDFNYFLDLKNEELITLFSDLRDYILELNPESNELLYHTRALTSVFTLSEKLSDAFCMIPIYTNHLNLGFNKGTLLNDSKKLLAGTGKLIRHIPISKISDYRNPDVTNLINEAIVFSRNDMDRATKMMCNTISKIKKI